MYKNIFYTESICERSTITGVLDPLLKHVILDVNKLFFLIKLLIFNCFVVFFASGFCFFSV